ncbi:cytochrome P450 [Scleroderma citrinum]
MSAPLSLPVDIVLPHLNRWLCSWQSSSIFLLLPILGVVGFALFLQRSNPIAHIPVYSIFPWPLSHFQFYDAQRLVYGGYRKYKGGVFRVLRSTGWVIIVTGRQLVEELHRIPHDTISLWEASKDELQVLHTFGKQVHSQPYQLAMLNSKLARHRDQLVRDLIDEAIPAFEEIMGRQCQDTSDWVEFNENSISKVVARIFNRILVGPELCRDPNYNQLSTDFTIGVFIVSIIINLFPPILRGIVGRAITQLPRYQKKGAQFLEPLIEERKAWKELGDDQDKPSDFLSFLVEGVPQEELTTRNLVTRILTVTTATTHTSTSTLTHALFELADRTSYVEPLRKEVENVMGTHGWTRKGVESMVLIDSFIKESMRMHPIGCMSFPMRALKPITLSDGTYIPKDSLVSTPFAVHFDDEFYENPYTFDGFRFASPAPEGVAPGGDGMTTTSASFLGFGHGRHAWTAYENFLGWFNH